MGTEIKAEEAIERIKEHIAIHQNKEPNAIHITEALNMAIKALEKQIQKEPAEFVWHIVADSVWMCPTCGGTLTKDGRYCKWCGQRIRV